MEEPKKLGLQKKTFLFLGRGRSWYIYIYLHHDPSPSLCTGDGGFLRKITGFWALCTCALFQDVWFETYVFCELNFSTPHFPIWTPDASANSHHQEMERSQASFLASWDLAVFHGLLSDLKKITPSMECFEAPETLQDSVFFLGMEFFDTNLWDLNKNRGKHRNTLGILCH